MNVRMTCALLLAICFSGITGDSILAQSDSTIVPGKRVRVTAPSVSPKRITGKIRELNLLSISIEYDSTLVQLDKNSILKLEVSKGSRRRYIIVGALAGTIVGLGTTMAGASTCESSGSFDFSCLAWLAAIPAGLVVGTVIGIAVSGERWEVVDWDRLRLSIGLPQHDLPGARLSISF